MNKSDFKINLQIFGINDKDFFTNAFEEAYNISSSEEEVEESPSEATEATENVPKEEEVEIPTEQEEAPVEAPQEAPKLSKEEIKKLYEETYGTPEPQLDEETQSAIELFKYLESNPHLVQAMREVDSTGYEQLNNYIPDEVTKKLQQMEEFIQEQQYNQYISDLKKTYSDFDEDKVLEYAEQKDIMDLEVAYKALKAETIKEPNIEEIREQIKQELLAELKNNSLSTQSIVGGINQKPINNNEDVQLSAREQRIAKAMGLTPSEYSKWK